MKKAFLLSIIITAATSGFAQLVATVQMKETVEGICNKDEVYALLPMLDKNQVEAKCPLPEKEIAQRINTESAFLKANPKTNAKGMVGVLINCEGKVVQIKMDNSTGKPELDSDILAVFKSLGEWTKGSLNGKAVDSSQLFSFKIKKGVLEF